MIDNFPQFRDALKANFERLVSTNPPIFQVDIDKMLSTNFTRTLSPMALILCIAFVVSMIAPVVIISSIRWVLS